MPADERLTHLDAEGRAHMVDVGEKPTTARVARAHAFVRMQTETLSRLKENNVPKGDVMATARIAGIQAAKETSRLIPLCHQLALTACRVEFETTEEGVHIHTTVECRDRTGVEMEALTAASVAALTLYDMLKAIDRGMRIECVELSEKSGGRSGRWVRD